MYNNDDLHILLKEAREGGCKEYGRLQVAVYDVLMRCICSNESYRTRAVATHHTVGDSVAETLTYVTDVFMRKYDAEKGSTPITYLVDGWHKRLMAAHNKITRYINNKNEYADDYRDFLEEALNPFQSINDRESEKYLIQKMKNTIKTLPLQQQNALEGYMQGYKLREISQTMGLTGERVRQIQAQAIKSLKQLLRDEHG